jgi:hypothetical protein
VRGRVGIQLGSESASELVGLAGVVHLPLRGSWGGVFVSRMIEEGKDDDSCDAGGRG